MQPRYLLAVLLLAACGDDVTGTWAAEGTGFALTWTDPIDHVEHVRPLGRLGIGPQLLTKQP